jgi:MOSC domain-containing protein YiiM
MNNPGIVQALYITGATGEPMTAMEVVRAIADRGLDGDRYCLGTGYYSDTAGWGANVTLIASEAIAAVNAGYSTDFDGAMLRRNIVTTGVQLESLIGRAFQCGEATLLGTKPFPPCAHLAYLTGRREVLKYFAYCGGIGAKVLTDGEIRLGDRIEILNQTE